MLKVIRRALDRLYDASAVLAALCLVLILMAIVLQMVARWAGVPLHGAAEYAGYLMASASFLAFSHALNRGAHIRVSMLLNAAGSRRFWLELWAMAIGTAVAAFVAFYAVRLVYWSFKLGDVSQGQDATPMWIPQLPMGFGAVLLAICFMDNLVTLLVTGGHNMRAEGLDQNRAE